jgi:tRNA-2-methylthio-N6-dimethylallyladenosine synthase
LAILIEKPGRHPGQMVGRSPYSQAVHLECEPDMAGLIIDAEIISAGPNSLAGCRAEM